MPEKIFIGKISKGLEQFYLPFNIDNDAFPTLYNAYTWRGRVKRKRGTTVLGRLQIQVQLAATPNNWQFPQFALVGGAGNLLTAIGQAPPASIVPGTITLVIAGNTYTEPSPPDGTLVGAPTGSGTINYTTGAITIVGGAASNVIGTFSFFPALPAMGLRNFNAPLSQYPFLLAFDTTYAYQILQVANTNPSFYNVSYYKGSNNPVRWSGQDYQQFWTTNYQGALWATNNTPGMHLITGTYVSGSGTTAIVFTFTVPVGTTLVAGSSTTGDKLWFNEWTGTINGKTGYISNIAGPNYTVTFTNTVTVSGSGIAQLLTNSIVGQDGIRWYDGDPTGGTGLPTGSGLGWVNFAPPLTAGTTIIDDNPAELYYMVGALAIIPFKDRLVFFSPYIQTSAMALSATPPIQLIDVALWSWNGTPYYAAPVPVNQSFDVRAYYVDQDGFGGWISAGIDQSIITVSNNEDVLLVGFTGKQARFVYTSNDLIPFLFYIINSELGTSSTFSSITLDRGALSYGQNGFILTTQVSSQRIDLQIPTVAFQINSTAANNAPARISSARDFYHEWVHFTFVPNTSQWSFPTQTFQYNYREDCWSIQYENFTTHGQFRKQQGFTWASNPWNASGTGWSGINDSWNSGVNTSLFPNVIAGTPQGFVVIKNDGTGEAPTGSIEAITNNGGFTQITSDNHCVSSDSGPLGDGGDYLYFLNFLGQTYLNGQIGRVTTIIDANNFVIDIPYSNSSVYLGLGTFTRLSQPLIQTKQFPVYWQEGRKVRVGVQKYLMDYTDDAQVSLFIYLSQDPTDAWNNFPIVPMDTANNSLIYSTVLYTCPESTNLGLSPITQSLNNPNPISGNQYQIWHRINTSLIGDTFQLGITLNDPQMRNLTYAIAEIGLHAIEISVGRGPLLS